MKAECRICFCDDGFMIQPCKCKGTMAYAHPNCLLQGEQYYCPVCSTCYHCLYQLS
jgi:E3 ubiquitin-protein ligase DOA10